jgi:preprotein translocase subunit SecA
MSYPERRAAPPGAADRLLGGLGWGAHALFGRRLKGVRGLAGEVREAARGLQDTQPAERLPELRYRVRREGLGTRLLVECFAIHFAARGAGAVLPDEVPAAAAWIARGGIAVLEDPESRVQALALAALARVLLDQSVHVVARSEEGAQALAAALRPAFGSLGLEVACITPAMPAGERRRAYACPVVCAPLRELGLDYLRDRVNAGGRPGRLRGELERLSAGQNAEPALLGGLHCALVHEADALMLDEVRGPLVIAREVEPVQERLMYEQAMELARSFTPEVDFTFGDEGVRLAEGAAGLLGRLVTPLGGVWAARERREQLVCLALEALHLLEQGVDYRVADGRVLMPDKLPEQDEEDAARDAVLQSLLEVKEGCRTSGRREVLARMSVPGFLSRYLHLGGACANARRLEREFWKLYRLKCAHARLATRNTATPVRSRVFVSRAAKHAALAEAAREAQSTGHLPLIAVRTPAEAQALRAVLVDADQTDSLTWIYPAQPRLPEGRPARVLIGELHDAGRHVSLIMHSAQAASARQFLALDDERTASSLAPWLLATIRGAARGRKELPARAAALVAFFAQRGAERLQAAIRQDLVTREQQQRDLLAFSGEAD